MPGHGVQEVLQADSGLRPAAHIRDVYRFYKPDFWRIPASEEIEVTQHTGNSLDLPPLSQSISSEPISTRLVERSTRDEQAEATQESAAGRFLPVSQAGWLRSLSDRFKQELLSVKPTEETFSVLGKEKPSHSWG